VDESLALRVASIVSPAVELRTVAGRCAIAVNIRKGRAC
jgi:hypothetical protein